MARTTVWLLALVLTCTPALVAASLEDQRRERPEKAAQGSKKDEKHRPQAAAVTRPPDDRWKWWLYDRAELGITDQQSAAINEIFDSTIPRLRAARHELEGAEEELSRMIKEHKADLTVVSLQLDRVENARSQHNKMRTLMLYRIHALLSPEQRAKLEALRARQNAARGEKPAQSGR